MDVNTTLNCVRRRRNPCSHALVRSTTQLTLPRPVPWGSPRRAIDVRNPAARNGRRYLSRSYLSCHRSIHLCNRGWVTGLDA